ncbi:hypothetical protein Pla52n_25700 [Stieleria varia]|uniref:Uncharacterized protein n=1 Tax=Stieleria varia TaxID=2528005 RepID=A0A5C6AZE0_9BACT|nr:hypothetical protein Pla52n_25700 [Stieleria varia]
MISSLARGEEQLGGQRTGEFCVARDEISSVSIEENRISVK